MSSPPIMDPFTDPYGYMGLSIKRIPGYTPTTPPSSDPSNPVLTKDVPINNLNNTWARLYLPGDASPTTKLPLIVYFHGGGFVLHSAASTVFQNFCNSISLQIPAVMVSVEYRLAPENRLPAAYDDCVEALEWIGKTDEEWLTKNADLSTCFLMGSSAGGNIAYRLGLDIAAAGGGAALAPVKIRGLILHQPFFGGVERTPSELRLVKDMVVPPHVNDLARSLALPVGVDRDHRYCNPFTAAGEVVEVKKQGWKVLVTGYWGDPLVDRQIEVAKLLEENGVDVSQHFGEGGSHAIEFLDDSKADIFYGVLKNFILALN